MSYDLITAAFDAKLQAMPVNGMTVQTDTTPFEPIEGQPYLIGEMQAYARMPTAMGPNGEHIENGSYVIKVVRPAAEGRRVASAVADYLVAYFSRSTEISTGSQVAVILTSGAEPAITDGAWVTVPVKVGWTASNA